METLIGRIADIQRFSLHNGPGIRICVFFKGCPLSCAWCHNPECIEFSQEELFYPEKCIGCGKCREGCYAGARVICGKDLTADELMEEIRREKPYFSREGGVTFSGGEPMAQPDFLLQMLDLCEKEHIHRAVETSLFLMDEKILQNTDLILADLKIWDSTLHQAYTGVGNERIKENFCRADRLGIPIIARTPVIPEIDQGIDKISEFLRSLDHVIQYELLPYHPFGLEKARALGKEQPKFSVPTQDFLQKVNQYAFIR